MCCEMRNRYIESISNKTCCRVSFTDEDCMYIRTKRDGVANTGARAKRDDRCAFEFLLWRPWVPRKTHTDGAKSGQRNEEIVWDYDWHTRPSNEDKFAFFSFLKVHSNLKRGSETLPVVRIKTVLLPILHSHFVCLPWVSTLVPPPRDFREICWTPPAVYEIFLSWKFLLDGSNARGGAKVDTHGKYII